LGLAISRLTAFPYRTLPGLALAWLLILGSVFASQSGGADRHGTPLASPASQAQLLQSLAGSSPTLCPRQPQRTAALPVHLACADEAPTAPFTHALGEWSPRSCPSGRRVLHGGLATGLHAYSGQGPPGLS
jgi:hypothetical protein